MGLRVDLPSKLTGETKAYTFDFTSELGSATILSAAGTAAVLSGTDASPSAIVSGSASISGSVVTQNVTAGTEGVIYTLTMAVTTSDSRVLEQFGLIAVVPVA